MATTAGEGQGNKTEVVTTTGLFSFLAQHGDYRRYWLAQVASQLGDRIHTLAVLSLVYSWTRSGSAIAVVLVSSTVPAILIAPWAGAFADRVDRNRLAIGSDLVRSGLVMALALLAKEGHLGLWSLALLTAFIGVASAFFTPATFALVPTIVPSDKLVQANAFTQLSASASAALGFLVGSGLLALLGAPLAFVTNATSFLFSAWMLSRIRHHGPVGSLSPGASSLGAGFAIIRGTPVLRQTVGVVIAVNLVFSSILVLLPVFGEGHFQGGSTATGILMASYTGGMFLAAALLGARPVPTTLSMVLVGGVGILTLAFLAMGTWVRLGVFLPSLVLVGFVVNGVNICLTTVFQRVVSPEDRGKFFAVFTAGAMSSQPIAYALAGLASDRMPPERILQGCSFGLGLIVLRLLRAPELRQHHVQG